MLDYIRGNAQSWGIKIIFGIIILVFVFWGIGRMGDERATTVAEVNGEAILVRELFQEMRRMEETLRANAPDLDSARLRAMNLQGRAESFLITNLLLRQEAERTGFSITPPELRAIIEKNPAFQNEKGAFDPESYLRMLDIQRTTPGRFEERIRRELLQRKLYDAVTAAVEVSEDEIVILFNFLREKRQISYLPFPLTDYLDKAQTGEDEIRAAYESDRAAFTVPAACDVEYVLASPKTLARPDAVSEEEIAAWYEKNPAATVRPEMFRPRHILLLLAPDAPESEEQKIRAEITALAARIKNGEDFSALAAQYSQDPGSAPQGGDLGRIGRGETVPAFENAALALRPGQVSEPVHTEFGLHLIKLEEHETARTRPLEEMRAEIRTGLAEKKGTEVLRDVLDQLIEANIVGTPLAETAKAQGLEVRITGSSDATSLKNKLSLDDKGAEALLKAPVGSGPDIPLEVNAPEGQAFIIARIRSATPEKVRELAEVREEIITGIRQKKARELAFAAAEQSRSAMGDTLPANLQQRVIKAQAVSRTEPVPGFGADMEATRAVFAAATPGLWLDKAFSTEEGAALLRLDARISPDEKERQNFLPYFKNSLLESRKQESFQNFVRLLAEKATIHRKPVNLSNEP